jgi:ABC-type nitrate/sulfonate/bicarbonate transport system substrate-binding protein
MAHELGLFAKHGISVTLSREIGWATIRDKILYGDLDAAHALAPMPFATTLGLGSVACECVTGLVLSLHGNAITLSNGLWERGVRDAKSLRPEIDRARGRKTYTFGVVFPYSSHNFLLRQWLLSGGIDPDSDVRLVVVPAPSMFDNLRSGNLDGYCVGEPWNSVAVQNKIGWCAATSSQLAPFHPEKVLMVRRQFAEENEAEHLALIAALREACAFCGEPANYEHVIATIAQPKYVNADAESVRCSLSGVFNFGHGRAARLPDFYIFARGDANEPTTDKAAWVLRNLRAAGLLKTRPLPQADAAAHVFRPDIFQRAKVLPSDDTKHELEKPSEARLVPA